jgi:hypothetical protein
METRGSYLRRIEEMKKRERVIQRSTTKPYDPSSMNAYPLDSDNHYALKVSG